MTIKPEIIDFCSAPADTDFQQQQLCQDQMTWEWCHFQKQQQDSFSSNFVTLLVCLPYPGCVTDGAINVLFILLELNCTGSQRRLRA